jgi:hypothetical protein
MLALIPSALTLVLTLKICAFSSFPFKGKVGMGMGFVFATKSQVFDQNPFQVSLCMHRYQHKSNEQQTSLTVTPAQAGVQRLFVDQRTPPDSCLRRNDRLCCFFALFTSSHYRTLVWITMPWRQLRIEISSIKKLAPVGLDPASRTYLY